MGLNKTFISLIFFSVIFCFSCSTDEIHITGTVRLSDDPLSGNGDVLVYTDNKETYSNSDGDFCLSGEVYAGYGDEFLIRFFKLGYNDTFSVITLPELEENDNEDEWLYGDRILDIGEMILYEDS